MKGSGTPQPAMLTEQHQVVDQKHQGPLSHAADMMIKTVLALAILAELGVVFFNIISRSFFAAPILWTDEAARLALSTIAFFGGAFAYRRGEHAYIRILVKALPLGCQRVCYVLVELLILTTAVVAGVASYQFLVAQWAQLTPVLRMHVSWFVIPLMIGMVVLVWTAIERLLVQHRVTVVAVGVAFSALILLLVLTQNAWRPWVTGEAASALSLALFLIPTLMGLPVGFALLLGALVYLFADGTVPMVALPHTMVTGSTNFVLLALPFFIFAAVIMNQGGLSFYLVRFMRVLVGHLRSGLLHVMVVSMYIVSGLSGSKAADVAMVGSVMRDMLRQEGYSLEQATAVLAASAVMGETVPPSIAMLVLGSVSTLSIGALFIAGLIPAAVVGLCIMALIYLQSWRSQVRRLPRPGIREAIMAGLSGVLPLSLPAMLIGGIVFGVATPTEVSSVAVVYGLILASFIYRRLGFRALVRGMIDCASVSGMILLILAGATSFAWTLTHARLPYRLVVLMSGAYSREWLFMLASILLLIVAGAVLDGLPALVILAPILLPIAAQLGIHELHYGIVLIIAMGIGNFAPPIGLGFYISCAICETTLEESTRAVVPYIVVLFIGVLLIGLMPWLTLYLPAKLHFGG